MLTFLFSVQFLVGQIILAPPPDTIAALEKRGLSTRPVDFSIAVDEAFTKRDRELFLALIQDMRFSSRGDQLADQVIRLYTALPEDDFKKSIVFSIAWGLQNVDRVMQSKWVCDFYTCTVGLLYSQSAARMDRMNAVVVVEKLSSRCGLTLGPYLTQTILVVPDNQLDVGHLCMEELRKCWSSVTPAMAYHIVQRWAYRTDLIPNKDVFAPFKERAKPLLDAKQLPPGTSREEVLKQLDAMIEAEGKKLCDKYSKMEYKPAPPPAPPSPYDVHN